MSLCDRRSLMLGAGALALLPACRFEPALEAGRGQLTPLYGQVLVSEPSSPITFVLTRQLEDRLGRGTELSPYALDVSLTIDRQTLGTDRRGAEQRVHLDGRARYALTRRGASPAEAGGTGALTRGTVARFTGYSATGNTVSTRAAENDARERLAVMLADGIFERLLLASPDLDLAP